jgi:hypothetical protein
MVGTTLDDHAARPNGHFAPGLQVGHWFGLFAPAKTPQAVVHAIGAAVAPILRTPAVRAELAAQGIESTGELQPKFARQVAAEYERYAQIVNGRPESDVVAPGTSIPQAGHSRLRFHRSAM